LPSELREIIVSETSSNIVWKAAENEHLTEEKIVVVSKLVGYVIMGFIHPEDLAGEIKNSLGIDARIAETIASSINVKIFQTIREELEQVYAPATSEENGLAGMPRPVGLEEIMNTPPLAPVPSPAPAPQTPEPKKSAILAPAPAVAAPIPAAVPSTPMPAVASAAFSAPAPVSKFSSRQLPVNMFSVIPAVKQPQEATGIESRPSPAPEKPLSSAMSQTEQPASSPVPFMLHQESELQPITSNRSAFKVGLSEEQFGKMEQKWTAPPRAAQIETSTMGDSAQNPPGQSARVVHYGEMRTPIPPMQQNRAQSSEESENPFEVLRKNSNNSR